MTRSTRAAAASVSTVSSMIAICHPAKSRTVVLNYRESRLSSRQKVSCFALLAALCCFFTIGCASGDDDSAATKAPSSATAKANGAPDSAATVKAFQTASNTTVKITVSSPVARNAVATVSVETAPNADCSITYETPSGTRSDAAGLEKKKADANGKAKWSFTIGPNTQTGDGQVRVICNQQDDVQTIRIT